MKSTKGLFNKALFVTMLCVLLIPATTHASFLGSIKSGLQNLGAQIVNIKDQLIGSAIGSLDKTAEKPVRPTLPTRPTITPASITVLSPNGGESYVVGQSMTVTWKSTGYDANAIVSISLDKQTADGYENTLAIPWANLADDGTETYTLPRTLAPGQYGIRIQIMEPEGTPQPTDSSMLIDRSDALFTVTALTKDTVRTEIPTKIITKEDLVSVRPIPVAPTCAINSFTATPSTISVGQTSTISWTTTGCKMYDIQMVGPNGSTDAGWQNLTTTKSFTFGPATVDDIGVTQITLLAGVRSSSSQAVNITIPLTVIDTSSTSVCNLKSKPSITVVSPNGGEVYEAGQEVTVTWKTCNIPKADTMKVLIGYFGPGSLNPTTAQTAVVVDNAHRTATIKMPEIPDTAIDTLSAGKYYKVVVTDTNTSPTLADWSDSLFTINTNSDLPSGCTLTSIYSSTTGQPCNQSSRPIIGVIPIPVPRTSNVLFLAGGSGSQYYNEVYSSSNMADWKLISANDASGSAKWSPRVKPAVVYFNNKYWIFGGDSIKIGPNSVGDINDVWSSADGVTWKNEGVGPYAVIPKTICSETCYPDVRPVVFNSKLYLIEGGFSAPSVTTPIPAKIWVSSNGTSWELANGNAPFASRQGFMATSFNGKLYVMGGDSWKSKYYSDVWSSADGKTWTQVTASASWGMLTEGKILVFKGKMYVLGGFVADSSGGGASTTSKWWSSADGINWTLINSSVSESSSANYLDAVVANDKIWVSNIDADTFWSSSDGLNWTKASITLPWASRNSYRMISQDLSARIIPPINPSVRSCAVISRPALTVESPNGGEVYQSGQQITVTWSACNYVRGARMAIDLIKTESDGAISVSTLITDTANDGTQAVSVPAGTAGTTFKIQVRQSSLARGLIPIDQSDANFTIN